MYHFTYNLQGKISMYQTTRKALISTYIQYL